MKRVLLVALAATLLVLPVTAQAHAKVRVRGTVTAMNTAEKTLTVTTTRLVHTLRVPGTLAAVRIGQRVELRGTTLRARGNGSRVLARDVLIVRSERRTARREDDDHGRAEVHGRIASLAPLTVAGVTCAVPAGVSLSGFKVGDRVEMKCVLVANVLTLRRLESEDADRDEELDDDDDDDDRGRDDEGNRGSGGGRSGRG
jgi:hypothetical protein